MCGAGENQPGCNQLPIDRYTFLSKFIDKPGPILTRVIQSIVAYCQPKDAKFENNSKRQK